MQNLEFREKDMEYYEQSKSFRDFLVLRKTLAFAFLLFTFYFLNTTPVVAATLSLSPSSAAVMQGETVSVNVIVASADRAMNAASGLVSFPNDLLEVVSVSKANSIATLWVEEPSFSNAIGTVSFEGVVLNPGFTGAAGRILTISFRGKSEGFAKLVFSSGSVLANDGLGTEILSGTSGTSIAIKRPTAAPAKKESVPRDTSSRSDAASVVITSETHPDQAKWYRDNSPGFSWTLPSGALEVRTIISESPRAAPSIRYSPPIAEKKVTDLPDGTFYFLLQVRTVGGWGPVTRFQVNIDKTPPEKFRIKFPHGTVGLNPQPIILFNSTDKTSGVDHYEVKVGEGEPKRTLALTDSNPYTLAKLEPGSYTVAVYAFDRAENVAVSEEQFTIERIEPPKITSYNEEMTVGDILRILGTTYPNADVEITVSDDEAVLTTEETKSNALGDFSIIISKRLWAGEYSFTARVTDDAGAQSPETKSHMVKVRFHFFSDAVTFIVNYFFIVLSFLIGIVIIAALGIWSWFKLVYLTRRMNKESEEAESILHRSFKVLRSDIDAHIRKLHKARASRALSGEELQFLKKFSDDLSEAEHIIAKEVADTLPVRKSGKAKPQ
ncbi:MAG: Uncharacterized protein Greene041679_430 [Parcubacteria group bacterium Greene0416_79]|nr:MAG: Uncharacterized protein Greene041679_430 [Parcubacteria group bacterium Greene0416_79]